MTKDIFQSNKTWNGAHPNAKPGQKRFAPDWPPLTIHPSDKHLFWGIEPEGPFKP